MQEIILKVLAVIGGASILLLGVFILVKVSSFFADFDSFKFETDLLLKFLKRDVCNLQEWKQKVVKIIAEHQDSVNLKIEEKINSQRDYFQKIFDMMNESRFDYSKHADKAIDDCLKRIKNLETNEGLYNKTIEELTEREREMSKVVEQLENKPDLDPMIFEKLAKLQDEINTEMKLSNIYGKQIDELVKAKKALEKRIEELTEKIGLTMDITERHEVSLHDLKRKDESLEFKTESLKEDLAEIRLTIAEKGEQNA